MWNRDQEQPESSCANCGQSEAVRGSSSWRHQFTCCGDSCGQELAAKIEANESAPEFAEAIVALEHAKQRVRDIKYKGLLVSSSPLEYVNGVI